MQQPRSVGLVAGLTWLRGCVRAQSQSCVSPQYMARQADINDKMRAILVDWLVEVHLKFKLTPETLFLTTNIIDRFLALHPVTRKHLQLVGVTAMLIASKYEEIWAPEVRPHRSAGYLGWPPLWQPVCQALVWLLLAGGPLADPRARVCR